MTRDEIDNPTTARFAEYLRGSSGEAPDEDSEAVPMLSADERQRVLVDWNRTEAAYPREVPLAALVEQQVARRPEAVAVVYGDETLTYRELNARANSLAAVLRARGAGPDVVVGVCLERSVGLVVALLAIIKAGAAYLPLDPSLPADRLGFTLQDSSARLVVAAPSTLARLGEFAGEVVNPSDALSPAESDQNVPVAVSPDHLAYVIYTSGSTGQPKGVQIPRGALTNHLWAMRTWLGFTESDRQLATTTISFDPAGREIWLPLITGGQTVVASREAATDGAQLVRLLTLHDITVFSGTPMKWQLLLEAGWPGKSDLRGQCGGEAMAPDLAARLVPIVRELWNMYGPTETTVASTGYLVSHVQDPVPIGRPLANTRCYILDAHRQPVPVGVVGELYIGGDGLARGYLNRPELTAERFLPDPFSQGPGARLYRTGDLARYRPDGQIECLGRTDHQVKIRGFRIEPGEIEARLAQHQGVKQAVVVSREDTPGHKRLVAYIVPSGAAAPSRAELRALLQPQVPDYMVPAAFVSLDAFPLTPNGKIDRRALPAPEGIGADEVGACVEPRTPAEARLTTLWQELLHLDRMGVTDNLFDLGADSLLVMRAVAAVREAFGVEMSVGRLVATPTIEGLACAITELEAVDTLPPDELERLLADLEQKA